MIAVIGAISLVSMLAAATLAATNGDVNVVQRDLDHRRAHAAAQAGVADYSFHLNNDNSYWSRCTGVPEPNAVNQVGSTGEAAHGARALRRELRDRTAAGDRQSELRPDQAGGIDARAERRSTPAPSASARLATPAGRRHRSSPPTNARACSTTSTSPSTRRPTRSPTATRKRSTAAYAQCVEIPPRRARERDPPRRGRPAPGSSSSAATKSRARCTPTTTWRSAATRSSAATPPTRSRSARRRKAGWTAGARGYGTANPEFIGPLVTTAPVLKPPSTNARLQKIAGPEYTYSCQTKIKLEGTNDDRDDERKRQSHQRAIPGERRHLHPERLLSRPDRKRQDQTLAGLLLCLLALQSDLQHLSGRLGLRDRRGQRQLLGRTDDRGRKQHRHPRRTSPKTQAPRACSA